MSDDFSAAADVALEHAAADAAAGLAREKGAAQDTNCLNCGAPLVGEFCHGCGQSGLSIRRPFWSLVSESLETFFSIDGRIAQTLPGLLLKPGRITRAYLDGQRARFIPPFRLYVLASLIFFVLMPLLTGRGFDIGTGQAGSIEEARANVERAYAEGELTEEDYRQAIAGLDEIEALWTGGIPGLVLQAPEPPTTGEAGEEAPAAPPDPEWAGFMPKESLDAVRAAGEAGDRDAVQFAEVMDNPERLALQTQEWIPRMMFVLLPVYAGLLALVYLWRRQFLFFDHLIVSLHFHSALFFAMSLGFLASLLVGVGWVVLVLIVYSNWYLYRLNRVVYRRSGYSSILRTLTLDAIYFGVLMSALLTAVILGALSL